VIVLHTSDQDYKLVIFNPYKMSARKRASVKNVTLESIFKLYLVSQYRTNDLNKLKKITRVEGEKIILVV